MRSHSIYDIQKKMRVIVEQVVCSMQVQHFKESSMFAQKSFSAQDQGSLQLESPKANSHSKKICSAAFGVALLNGLLFGSVNSVHAGTVQGKMNDSFYDTIGINTHLWYYDTPYGSAFNTVILPRLQQLRVRHIRENMISSPAQGLDATNVATYYSRCRAIVQASPSTKFNLVAGIEKSSAYINDAVTYAQNNCSNAIESIEAYNEPDISGPYNSECVNGGINNWYQCTAFTGMPGVYFPVKAAKLSQPPLYPSSANVIAPALTSASAALTFNSTLAVNSIFNSSGYTPNILSYVGNMHNYTGTFHPETPGWGENYYLTSYAGGYKGCQDTQPSSFESVYRFGSLDYNLNCIAKYSTGRNFSTNQPNPPFSTVYATEVGFHNFLPDVNGVPEDISSRTIPRLFFFHFNKGIARTYLYELINDVSTTNPFLAPNQPDANFGLIRQDGSLKPAYTAFLYLDKLADPGAAFTVDKLNYSVSVQPQISSNTSHCPSSIAITNNAPSFRGKVIQQTVLQSRSKEFYLAIWLGIPAYDGNTSSYINLDPNSGTLRESCKVPVVITLPPSVKQVLKAYKWRTDGGIDESTPPLINGKVTTNLSDTILLLRLSTTQTVAGQTPNTTLPKEITYAANGTSTDTTNTVVTQDTVVWTYCANQNGTCSIEAGSPTPTKIRYGANGAYTVKPYSAANLACNSTTFADPLPGVSVTRQCEYQ
jgi:hypothetical protein